MATETHDTLEKELRTLVRTSWPGRAKKQGVFNLDRYVRKADKNAYSDAKEIIPKHLVLLRLACRVMLLLAQFVRHGPGGGKGQRGAFIPIQHRATNDLLSCYRLLTAGFEDTARAITRPYLESVELGLVCLTNEELAEKYSGEDGDPKFWENHVGYGRIYQHLANAYKLAGRSEDDIEYVIKEKKKVKNILSSAVHVEMSGAFRSWAIPLLGYKDLMSLNPHGCLSIHTADHIRLLVHETYDYCVTVINLMTRNIATDVFRRPDAAEHFDAFMAHAIAFQTLFRRYRLGDGFRIRAPASHRHARK